MTDAERGVAELRAELAELREHVRVLTDRHEIVECLHRYARGLDRHDAEVLASAYHPDGIDNHGAFTGHPPEFIEWADELMQEWDIHLHFLDPNSIEVEGDTAHSQCYVLFTQRRADGGGLDWGGGRYIDRLERRDGEWRIALRRTVIDWTAHATAQPFAETTEYPRGTCDRTDLSYMRPLALE